MEVRDLTFRVDRNTLLFLFQESRRTVSVFDTGDDGDEYDVFRSFISVLQKTRHRHTDTTRVPSRSKEHGTCAVGPTLDDPFGRPAYSSKGKSLSLSSSAFLFCLLKIYFTNECMVVKRI